MVLAEVLQGATTTNQLSEIDSLMSALPYEEATRTDWIKAADLAVELRNQGKMTALSDLLIAAQALEGDHEVFTTDPDFKRVPGLRLH
jgi:predicted nucleic acid-binding protein